MDELKQCPFCGSSNVALPAFDHDWHFCTGCGAVSGSTKNEMSNWNTRPREDALQARIDALIAEDDNRSHVLLQRIDALEAELATLRIIEKKAIEQSEYIQSHGLTECEVAGLKAELATLREQNRWIPTSERLPEKPDLVLIISMLHTVDFARYSQKTKHWTTDDGIYCGSANGFITHWRELPVPPEEE